MWLWLTLSAHAVAPRPAGGVLDDGRVLAPQELAALRTAIAEVEPSVAVVTTRGASADPGTFADELLAAWFPDEPGVIFLLDASARRLVTRANPGARELVDDRWLAVLQEESMVPRLARGEVGDALLAGVLRLGDRPRGNVAVGWVVVVGGLILALGIAAREARG